jgi:hypothetical protein
MKNKSMKHRKGSKCRKSGRRGRRLAKTRRRMMGRGWFDWVVPSSGPDYMQVSTEESKPVMVTDVVFKDGEKSGKYTGRALYLGDGYGYSRQDPVGIMKYDDGSKYMGPFVNNKRHGLGVLTAKESCDVGGTRHDECDTQLEGNWVDNVLTGKFNKKYYNGDTMLMSANGFVGNRQQELDELAEKSRKLDAFLSKIPQKQKPVSHPPVQKQHNFVYSMSPEERKALIADTKTNIIEKFDPK